MNSTIKACQEAAKLLLELRQSKCPPLEPGWFTIEQFAEHSNCHPETARRGMFKLVESGKFVSQPWPVPNRLGRVRQKTIYRKK